MEDENKITRSNLFDEPHKYLSSYALVTFKSYQSAYDVHRRRTISNIAKTIKEKHTLNGLTPGSGGSHDHSNEEFLNKHDIELFMAPHPYDIDWNAYNKLYTKGSYIWHVLAWCVVIFFIPVLTYFVEFKLSMTLAMNLKGASKDDKVFITHSVIFMSIRIVLSV